MVHEVEPVLHSGVLDVGWPLHRAGEVWVNWREGCFGHLAEFVEDIGDLSLVGLVVHEDDDALAGEDHFGEGRPIVEGHGYFGGVVYIFGEAGVDNRVCVVADADIVAVDEEDGDYVVGVVIHPLAHG